MLYRYLWLIFFMLFGSGLFGQQAEKWVHGNIILDPDGEMAEGVYVTNLRTKEIAISNFAGNFSIRAKEGDVLDLKSDYYENRKIKLSHELFAKNLVVIHLNINVIELQTALITAHLTGILTKDVKAGKRTDKVTKLYKQLGVNPDINPIRDTSALKAGFFNGDISLTRLDIGRIYDVLSGDMRKRKATLEFEAKADRRLSIRKYFGDDYFINDLKIPSYKINDFIEYTYANSGMSRDVENGNYLSIMEKLIRFSTIYRRLVLEKIPESTTENHPTETPPTEKEN
ncbi:MULTISPECIES: hypothetical protein [Weeksella]|uniref:hypothetical protein n=1 Tax=Weeksella TaxID=1013 RepID=UPI002100C317|nr:MULTISPECIES: hypothetical protein [Weeksella]MDK7374978.1 hypothetical protein [Weeksella virosa]